MPPQYGYHGPAFPDTWGMMQVRLISLTLLNVIVDNAIRTWLAMTVEDQKVVHNGMGEAVGRCMGVFYADDGMVESRNSN